MSSSSIRPRVGALPALLAALMLIAGVLGSSVGASPAQAAAGLSASSSAGAGKASASGATTMTVRGSGYQSIKNGFGGIYVVFGYLANSSGWKPSQGGTGGKDFFYIADSQSKNNKGYQRFVSYPGSSTAESANGGTISANGSFRTSVVIPGPTFTATTSSGSTKTIDCHEVTCGIITFGAHGVSNGNNEAFTPVSFGTAAASTKTQQAAQPTTAGSQNSSGATTHNGSGTTGGTVTSTTTETQQADTAQGAGEQGVGGDAAVPAEQGAETTTAGPAEPVTNGEATLGLEQQAVIAGRSLGFTGRGFAAGEQVVATLSSGLTAAGPITAGQFGEIAGVVQIPLDAPAGTNKIKLTGAGSGNTVETEFSVVANAQALATADTSDQQPIRWALIAVVVAAALLLVLIVSSLIAAIMRRSKKTKSTTAAKAKRPAKRRRRVRRVAPSREPLEARAAVAKPEDTHTTALDQLDEAFERSNS